MLHYEPTTDKTKEAITSLVEGGKIRLSLNEKTFECEPVKISNMWYLKNIENGINYNYAESLSKLKAMLLTDYYCGKITNAQITYAPAVELEL